MPWVFLDDDFHSNPKILEVGNAAAGVYARALSYCGAHLTNGFVPEAWMKRACGREISRKICEKKLMTKVAGGYKIPDYLDNNPSKADVEKRRGEWRERQARARDRKKEMSRRDSHGDMSLSKGKSPRDSLRPLPLPQEREVRELPTVRVKGIDLGEDAEVIDLTAAPRKKQHPDNLDNRFRKSDGTAGYTGCRQTRGQGGFGYVYDPLGIDYPPADWPHAAPTSAESAAARAQRRTA